MLAVFGIDIVTAKLPVARAPLAATGIWRGPCIGYEVPLPTSAAPFLIVMGSLSAPDASVRLVGVVPPVPVPIDRQA